MQRLRSNFDARRKSRTGTREVSIRFESVDAIVADGRRRTPLLGKRHVSVFVAGLLGAVTARRNENHVGNRLDDVLQADAKSCLTRQAEEVNAAGAFDHLRYPVAADVKGIEPFEKRDSRMMLDFSDGAFDRFELAADFFEQMLGFFGAAGLFADPQNVSPYVAKIERI